MVSRPSGPHAPHTLEPLCPEPPRLVRQACWLALLGSPFLVLCVLALLQIGTDAYPRTDATLSTLASVRVPVTSVAATARWNACVRHRLQHRLAWFGPMSGAFVDQVMTRCLADTGRPDPELVRRMPVLHEQVARLWQDSMSMFWRSSHDQH